jgi:hypothetical protein
MDLMTGSDRDKAKRAMEAMMTMKKIDIAALEAAAGSASIRGDELPVGADGRRLRSPVE